jgi:hypothetical protein
LDKVLGGRHNKDACEAQNDVSYGPRPASLFSDTTLKSCSDLSPKCFENMRRPAARLSCAAQSGSDLELKDDDDDDLDAYDEDGDDAAELTE